MDSEQSKSVKDDYRLLSDYPIMLSFWATILILHINIHSFNVRNVVGVTF